MIFMKLHTHHITTQAEAAVIGMEQDAAGGLSALKGAAAMSFERLWKDKETTHEKLEVLGANAALAFQQHYDTVLYLLRSYARSHSDKADAKDLAEMLADPATWLFTHTEHALALAVLTEMPPATFTPPVPYKIHDDGTVTV